MDDFGLLALEFASITPFTKMKNPGRGVFMREDHLSLDFLGEPRGLSV